MNKNTPQIAREFILNGNLEKAITFLLKETEGKYRRQHQEIVFISHKWKDIKNNHNLHFITNEDFLKSQNIITIRLLNVIDVIGESEDMMSPPTKSNSRPFLILNIFSVLFELISGLFSAIFVSLIINPIEKVRILINRNKIIKIGNQLVKCAELNENLIDEIAFIRSEEKVTISIKFEGDFEFYKKTNASELLETIKSKLDLKEEVSVKKIVKGSVIISLEMSSEDAEKLYLAIKLKQLKEIEIEEAKLVGFRPVEISEIKDLEDIKDHIKREIANNFETGLSSLEKLLNKKSKRYNDLILVKSSYSQSNRMFTNGLIDFDTFKIQMNKFIKSLIDIVEDLVGVDIHEKMKKIN